jgi:GNAT superfamily N-acetyltransferase
MTISTEAKDRPMRIRLAAEADLAGLRHLYNERMALLAQGDRHISAEAVQWLDRESGGVWVGDADDMPAGYVSVWRAASEWRIDHMALDAHTYHPGLARALINAVRDAAHRDGASYILVRVPTSHPVEQAFWRALGAVRVNHPAQRGYQWMQVNL